MKSCIKCALESSKIMINIGGFLPKNLLHYTLNKKNKLLPIFKFSFNNFIGKENLNNLYLINLLCMYNPNKITL